MVVLVTGGAGFIGTFLIKQLAKDHQVISIDDYSAGMECNHIEHSNVTYIDMHTKDVKDSFVKENNIELVYHLGEYARIAPSFVDIDQVFDSNIVGSYNIVTLCLQNDIPIIYSASSTKFANEGVNHSPYTYTKSFTLDLIKNYSQWYNLKYSICYFDNVYGHSLPSKWEQRNYQSVIEVFKQQKLDNEPITVCGDGSQSRNFTHINDIVDGLILSSDKLCNDEYYLGVDNVYSILEVAKLFNHPYKHIDARLGDRQASVIPDIEATHTKLNWIPKHNLEDYIKNIK